VVKEIFFESATGCSKVLDFGFKLSPFPIGQKKLLASKTNVSQKKKFHEKRIAQVPFQISEMNFIFYS
jgi:hypothetical protein